MLSREAAVNALSKKFCRGDAKKIERKIYEKYSDDESYYFELVCDIYTNTDKVNQILKEIKKDIPYWKISTFSGYRETETKETEKQAVGMKVTKGEFRCKSVKCRSDECYTTQVQTRSIDEGATTYVLCSKCGEGYKFN